MRSNKYIKSLINLFFAGSLLCNLSSCKEDEFPVDDSYARMFRPHTLTARDVTATSAVLEWPVVSGTQLYVLELAADSLEFSNIARTIEINTDTVNIPSGTTKISLTFNRLIGDTKYSARIKSTSKDNLPESGYSFVFFKTNPEQIMKPVSGLEYTTATLNWTPGADVTHIKLLEDGGTVQIVELTQEEKTTGIKVLTGLTQAKSYNVEIYNTDSNRRGYTFFTTYLKQIPGADLTIELLSTDSINQATFDTLTASSITFVLPKGAVYSNNNTLTLKSNTSITFYAIPVGDRPKTIMSIKQFVLPEIAGTIKFENIDLSGYKYVNGAETTSKVDYIFNQGAATSTDAVIFDNCTIRNFNNTPFRLQGSNTINIGRVSFNNCIVFDMQGNYSTVHSTTASCKINNIEFTNSTFYNITNGLIVHSGSSTESVKIENCTFDDIVKDSKYFVDFGSQTTNKFDLSNCLFGKTKSTGGLAKGIRIASTTVTAVTSFKTNDFVLSGNSFAGLQDYNNPSTSLFVDPANGNFNFKDQNFEGVKTTGDPRWRINL